MLSPSTTAQWNLGLRISDLGFCDKHPALLARRGFFLPAKDSKRRERRGLVFRVLSCFFAGRHPPYRSGFCLLIPWAKRHPPYRSGFCLLIPWAKRHPPYRSGFRLLTRTLETGPPATAGGTDFWFTRKNLSSPGTTIFLLTYSKGIRNYIVTY